MSRRDDLIKNRTKFYKIKSQQNSKKKENNFCIRIKKLILKKIQNEFKSINVELNYLMINVVLCFLPCDS